VKKGANYRAVYIAIPVVLLSTLVTLAVMVYYRKSVFLNIPDLFLSLFYLNILKMSVVMFISIDYQSFVV
jgi:hypothetical protein